MSWSSNFVKDDEAILLKDIEQFLCYVTQISELPTNAFTFEQAGM